MRIEPPVAPVARLGPCLLSGVGQSPELADHRRRHGPVATLDARTLADLAGATGIRGRGGAAFPLVRKIETALASGRRRAVVVNAAEGEPASAKDAVLLEHAPHLVLDGAVLAARALRVREVHVVVSSERPAMWAAAQYAIAERDDGRLRFVLHEAAPTFIAGQARAVLELLAGREGLPVTAWAPEAVSGLRGRPTLLANAETYAHLAAAVADPSAYAALGTPDEPGTTLLTITRMPGVDGVLRDATVVEVGHGTPLRQVLSVDAAGGDVLVGGFHGRWVPGEQLIGLPVSRAAFEGRGLTLGAGVLVVPTEDRCVVAVTADIVDHLAAASAGRCGPCRLGLPTLADEMRGLAEGADTRRRLRQLITLVDGRGACAHPDGTAWLVRSLLDGVPSTVASHLAGTCGCPRLAVAVA